MTNLIDLHSHSTASDGTFSPTQLVALAAEKQLTALALTDHDTLSGLDEFLAAGEEFPGVRTIPGVEISVRLERDNEAHIVGLFIDHRSPDFNAFLSEIRTNRNQRNEDMLHRLNSLGYVVNMDELLALSPGESVGRPAVAALLIQKGYFDTMGDVFDACLRRGMPGYVPRVLPTPEACIHQIHAAGGVAIWAHPVYRRKNERTYVRVTLENFQHYRLDGIETYYTVFTESQHRMLCEFAERYHLVQSGGSDFHGGNQPRVSLGSGFGDLQVPESLLAPLEARHREWAAQMMDFKG